MRKLISLASYEELTVITLMASQLVSDWKMLDLLKPPGHHSLHCQATTTFPNRIFSKIWPFSKLYYAIQKTLSSIMDPCTILTVTVNQFPITLTLTISFTVIYISTLFKSK